MEASAALVPAGSPGDLVALTGQPDAPRLALTGPVTLLGSASCCDLRPAGDSLAPLHCALVAGPSGLVVRDLTGDGGTRVNGQPVGVRLLAAGDELDVRVARYRVELAAPRTDVGIPNEEALEGEREAARIQVAAVVAQQAALTEDEARLEQKAVAQARQFEQLAAHLEELRARAREEKREAEAVLESAGASRDEAACDRAEAARLKADAASARTRVSELRRRLHRRWKRHFSSHDADLARREQLLALDREKLKESWLAHSTDSELERCRLREEWQELGLAQQRWEEGLEEERRERARRLADLEARAREVEAAAEAQATEGGRWQLHVADLRRESEGLEERIRNQRARLEGPAARPAPTADIIPPTPPVQLPGLEAAAGSAPGAGANRPDMPISLLNLADDLADQRRHLAEQWERLLEVHGRWQRERDEAQSELEGLARHLDERERETRDHERHLGQREDEVRRRGESLSRRAGALEGWQARLTLQTAGWEAERSALASEALARERLAQLRASRLEEVHRRRNRRRRQDLSEVQQLQARGEEARQAYLALWQECQQRRGALDQEARALAGRAVAIERYRLELLGQSERAEQRIERLAVRETERLEQAARDLGRQRAELLAECARLDARARVLAEQDAALGTAREEIRLAGEEVEARAFERQAAEDALRHDLDLARARQQSEVRTVAALREEIERVARALMGDEPGGELPQQAVAA